MKLKDKLRWTYFTDMLKDEYKQCLLEGRQVEGYAKDIDEIMLMKKEEDREAASRQLLLKMESAPMVPDYQYEEPESYEDILKVLPAEDMEYPVNPDQWKNSLKGAWHGRMAGCLLGIPVESWTRDKILNYLKESGQYPITGYLTGKVGEELRKKYGIKDRDEATPYDRQEICWIENAGHFPVDDDVNYPVMALKLVERCGRGLDSQDVGEGWLLSFPGLHACTAERAAYRNIINGILPPACGKVLNPYREWIGAQIRGDFWGYINPGKPREAARMAYLDGSVSHSKNGVYAEMMIAALISLCYCKGFTKLEILERALKQIPPRSRAARAVKSVADQYKGGADYQKIVEEIHAAYDESEFFDWCYVIPNLMLVIAIFLYFGDDYSKAISAAIYCGFDTDCNGATVGSASGAYLGFENIDPKWFSGIEMKMETSIHGYHVLGLDEAVERTLKLIL